MLELRTIYITYSKSFPSPPKQFFFYKGIAKSIMYLFNRHPRSGGGENRKLLNVKHRQDLKGEASHAEHVLPCAGKPIASLVTQRNKKFKFNHIFQTI